MSLNGVDGCSTVVKVGERTTIVLNYACHVPHIGSGSRKHETCPDDEMVISLVLI